MNISDNLDISKLITDNYNNSYEKDITNIHLKSKNILSAKLKINKKTNQIKNSNENEKREKPQIFSSSSYDN